MGNAPSAPDEVLQRVMRSTKMEEKEVNRLYGRFATLDVDESNQLTRAELLNTEELALCPLAARVIEHMLLKGDGTDSPETPIDFEQFMQIVATFSPNASIDSKLEMLFDAFDQDDDGFVDADDVVSIWKLLVHVPMTDAQRLMAAQQVIENGDVDKDGKWSQAEFNQAMDKSEVIAKMTLTF